MTWTTYEDVEQRWFSGPLPANEQVVETLIEDAEDYLKGEISGLEERLEDESLSESAVIRVVCRMVMRVLRNPEGHRSLNQGAGSFTQSVTFGGDDPGSMYLTKDERKELSRRRSRLFSIDMESSRVQDDEALWHPYP